MCQMPNTPLVTTMAAVPGMTRRSAACSTPRNAISSHRAVPTGMRISA
jgi:hypothetical protein